MSLCLSMSIGLLLILIVLYQYQSIRKVVLRFSGHLEMAEKTREIIQFLGNDLHYSAYRGPRTRDPSFPVYVHFDSRSHPYLHQDRAVQGCESPAACVQHLPPSAMARAKPQSNLFIVYNIPKKIQAIAQTMQNPSGVIKLEHPTALRAGSVILVSDGLSSDCFIATALQGLTLFHGQTPYGNRRDYLSKAYPKGSELMELQSVAYYLGRPLRSKPDPETFSLYRDDLCHEAEEIAEGIKAMHIEYAIWEPLRGLRFAAASALSDQHWPWVIGLRVELAFHQPSSWSYDFAIRNGTRADRDSDRDHPKQSMVHALP